GYVGTGEDASGLKKDFFKFDPIQNTWGVIADFGGTPREKAIAFSMGAVAFVGTGDDGVFKNDLWQYEVFQNTWTQKASLPGLARAGATAWANFPNGYVATGEDINFNFSNEVWEYNYFNNQWSQRASIPAAGRKDACSFIINGIAFLGTGFDGSNLLDDFYAYQGIVGLDENTNQTSVRTFPNPASNQFTISLTDAKASDLEIVFYTAEGREVSTLFNVQQNDAGFDVRTDGLAKGIYYFQIRTNDAKKTYNGSIVLN
ncbi:MAG: T9SS type A sorting domain-containing protein, partial [Bacteroidia bacterium]